MLKFAGSLHIQQAKTALSDGLVSVPTLTWRLVGQILIAGSVGVEPTIMN